MTERTSSVEPPLVRHNVRVAMSSLAMVAVLGCLAVLPSKPSEPQRRKSTVATLEIDVNLASEIELSLAPGVGPVLAKRIVANREREGAFPTLQSLCRVHGVGPKTLDQIATICVVDPPQEPMPDHIADRR
ncbi:helix-hairpin-helix domain-containing protein [Rubripirellula amarantea]|uniref:ComE operon protein 1 n=1 Tax=Rubripirellula amarantea TaxID=2527999 RepID=A0A5C5WQP9_9BACT|nr:helix-hairpin-helix domain-containing protein [Rubripirellula amarantea]MDA8744995.1 helix-hairpin-helix domain-containing protein [Rubripirellula amarantea]TWT52867.1 ComE operon protein 1 [Rubripirellula amarantea]